MEREKRAERITSALMELRARKFAANQPFLILSNNLQDDQAYCEYADGRIEIRQYSVDISTPVRELTTVEAYKVRRDYGLL